MTIQSPAGHAIAVPGAVRVPAPPVPRIEAASPSPEPGWTRRSVPLLLAAAVCLPLLVLLASGLLSWREAWRQARLETLRTADAAAEYAGRVLDGHRLLLLRVDDMLRGRADADIRQNEGLLRLEINRMLEGLPNGLTSFVLDREGHALLAANLYPVPREPSFRDREFFQVLSAPEAPATHVSRVLLGRVDNTTFFAISRRRTAPGNGLPRGSFDGLVNVSVFPSDLTAGLRQMLGDSEDLITLVRADGEVLANTIGFTRAPPPLPPGPARAAMARQEGRLSLMLPAEPGEPARIAALRQVAGWPVYALASRPEADVAGAWRTQMMPQLAVGLPASALLALLALLVWRQQGALKRAYRGLETRVKERTAALAASEAEFRATFDSSIMGKAQADLHNLRLTRANRRFCEITGYDTLTLTAGMTLPELGLLEAGGEEEAHFRAAMTAEGRYETDRAISHRSGRQVWVHLACALIQDGSGRQPRIIAAVQDITDRKLAEERQALLAREVDHRAKNALAVVQAALRLTPKRDADDFARSIEGRVGALARAQTVLARTRWEGAGLRDLAAGELAAFLVPGPGGPQVRISGPPTSIPAVLTQPLSMALHELATNAVKHGALSQPGGELGITWWVEAAMLRLDWHERGGPPVAGQPERSGFGSRLLQATIGQQLGGRLTMRWEPEGLHAVLEVPLARPGSSEPAEV